MIVDCYRYCFDNRKWLRFLPSSNGATTLTAGHRLGVGSAPARHLTGAPQATPNVISAALRCRDSSRGACLQLHDDPATTISRPSVDKPATTLPWALQRARNIVDGNKLGGWACRFRGTSTALRCRDSPPPASNYTSPQQCLRALHVVDKPATTLPWGVCVVSAHPSSAHGCHVAI